jgi:hypothetical protein
MKRTLELAVDDFSTVAKVGPEMRTMGLGNDYLLLLVSVEDELLVHQPPGEQCAALKLVGKSYAIPTGWKLRE